MVGGLWNGIVQNPLSITVHVIAEIPNWLTAKISEEGCPEVAAVESKASRQKITSRYRLHVPTARKFLRLALANRIEGNIVAVNATQRVDGLGALKVKKFSTSA
jgi:hypothetical protein